MLKTKYLMMLLLAVMQAGAADQAAVNIELLLHKSPQAALEAMDAYWPEQTVELDNFEKALLKMYVLSKNSEAEQALALHAQFAGLDGLTTEQEALLVARELELLRAGKIETGFKQATARAESLIAELSQSDSESAGRPLQMLNQQLGFNLYYQAKFEQAEPYFLAALSQINPDNIVGRSKILNTIGVINAQQAKLAQGAQYMLDAIKLLENNGLEVTADRYRNLGSLYFLLNDFEQSIEYSLKSLAMTPEATPAVASTYNNLATAYVKIGENEMAIEAFEKSIKISTDLGSTTSTARLNLGELYNLTGQYEKALEQHELSASELDDIENAEIRGVSLKSRADVYANMGQHQKAIDFYEQAYLKFQESDLTHERIKLYPKMVEVLVKVGNFRRAYEMMVEYKALEDEINSVAAKKELNEILTSFDVEKKERALIESELALEKQQASIELLNSQSAFEQRIRLLMYVLLAALAIVLLLVFRSLRYRGKVNQILLTNNARIEQQHLQLSELNEKLKKQAENDNLTGLKNRRYVTQLIAETMAKQDTVKNNWCLIMLDIDDFKQINDQYGHQRGDEVLKQFAQVMQDTAAEKDVVARWGGEEFLWLAVIDELDQGPQKCQRLQDNLANNHWFREGNKQVTCSIGFSSFPLVSLNFEDWEAALALADHGLYQVKNTGKDSWYGFELMDAEISYDKLSDIDGLVQSRQLKTISKP
ncbi:diguanylate cyclase [Marinicella sp. S1101]|uniref:GGDEF domain-containing protein n=1 Tax=Marinicella marina TaxID=2996016 RepID=UPI002260B467|nr:diguanylate cyclase [Marinicella marina]MCX7554392.1 diguanylate cyclase [Marinicella marina]MDJ1138617.1 diguanylate cyclase [Marinicella marina]